MENLRPCVFKTEDDTEHTGYFHTWEQISVGKTAFMRAIVEQENGEIIKVAPSCIIFTDRKSKENVLQNDDYNKGLHDAWKLAERMCHMQYDGLEEILERMHDDMYMYFVEFTPQEVLEKFNNQPD